MMLTKLTNFGIASGAVLLLLLVILAILGIIIGPIVFFTLVFGGFYNAAFPNFLWLVCFIIPETIELIKYFKNKKKALVKE